MPPYCEKHQRYYITNYVVQEFYCTECHAEKVSVFKPLPKAIETTEILNEVKADKGILTEEELRFFEENALGTNYWNMTDALQSVINSHRAIQERNRNLVLENDELNANLIMQKVLQNTTDEIIDDYVEEVEKQNEEICRLQDEISRLKGENNHE